MRRRARRGHGGELLRIDAVVDDVDARRIDGVAAAHVGRRPCAVADDRRGVGRASRLRARGTCRRPTAADSRALDPPRRVARTRRAGSGPRWVTPSGYCRRSTAAASTDRDGGRVCDAVARQERRAEEIRSERPRRVMHRHAAQRREVGRHPVRDQVDVTSGHRQVARERVIRAIHPSVRREVPGRQGPLASCVGTARHAATRRRGARRRETSTGCRSAPRTA